MPPRRDRSEGPTPKLKCVECSRPKKTTRLDPERQRMLCDECWNKLPSLGPRNRVPKDAPPE